MIRFIHGQAAVPVRPQHRNAIVTMCIGDEYTRIWEAMCQPGWERYCAVHNFDLIVVTDHLDNSERAHSRSPAWEKLLVLVQPWAQHYERIVWVDADIVISRYAPDILQSAPDPEKIGITFSYMSDVEKHVYIERLYNCVIPPQHAGWRLHDQSIFKSIGAPLDCQMFNTGVMALSPRHHADLLRGIYDKDYNSRVYEQPFLSAEISTRGIAQLISPRFNWSAHEILMMNFPEVPADPVTPKLLEQLIFVFHNEMKKAYFMHFCGSMPFMSLLYRVGIHSLEDSLPMAAE